MNNFTATGFLKNCVLMALFLFTVVCADAYAYTPGQAGFLYGLSATSNYDSPSPQSACDTVGKLYSPTAVFSPVDTGTSGSYYCTASGFVNQFIVVKKNACSSGYTYAGGTCVPDTVPDNTCAGYATPELAVTNSWAALQNPVCTRHSDDRTQLTCSGTSGNSGKQTSIEYSCGGSFKVAGPIPGPPVVPATPVAVDFPDCPAGSYQYTDLDGSSSCSTPAPPDVQPPPCASGNAGSVNGNFVCLPANPAPASAASAAATAQQKANIAKDSPGSAEAIQAAKDAAIAAQKAKDAADSLPGSAPAASDSQRAIDAARQAAGYAGQPYGGPRTAGGTSGSGGGGGDNSGCGLPGKPKCQIDETGTPDGAATKITDAQVQALTDGRVAEMTKKQDSFGLSWNFQLPQGACVPLDLTYHGIGKVFDWCPYLQKLRTLIGWFYMMLTAMGLYASYSGAVKFNRG